MTGGWLIVEQVPDRQVIPLLRGRIDEGEAEAIELARQTQVDLLILDELAGREIAGEMSLPYTGLLGILAAEKLAGNMASLKTVIDRLRSECRFFISEPLEKRLLEGVGEG